MACIRALRGEGVTIVMRATRYDPSTPRRWWSTRSDIRWVVTEFEKLLAYGVGMGG